MAGLGNWRTIPEPASEPAAHTPCRSFRTLRAEGVQVFFNRSGNSWAAPHQLAVFPGADGLSSVQVVDLLGNGTACLVWSSPLPGQSRSPLRYVDLMGSIKPHLLTRMRNNLGSETRLAYAPSTRFYLRDRLAGRAPPDCRSRCRWSNMSRPTTGSAAACGARKLGFAREQALRTIQRCSSCSG